MKLSKQALHLAALLIMPLALQASATIQAVYHTIDKIVSPKKSLLRIHDQFGQKPLLKDSRVICSFIVEHAQPRKGVILDFCTKNSKNSIVTKWRLTLGEQVENRSDQPFSVYSSLEHLAPDTGNVLESHKVKHPAGKAFIKDNHPFHVMFKLNKQGTLLFKVFEGAGKRLMLQKKFQNVAHENHYLVPTSDASTVTYSNMRFIKLPPEKEAALPNFQ